MRRSLRRRPKFEAHIDKVEPVRLRALSDFNCRRLYKEMCRIDAITYAPVMCSREIPRRTGLETPHRDTEVLTVPLKNPNSC